MARPSERRDEWWASSRWEAGNKIQCAVFLWSGSHVWTHWCDRPAHRPRSAPALTSMLSIKCPKAMPQNLTIHEQTTTRRHATHRGRHRNHVVQGHVKIVRSSRRVRWFSCNSLAPSGETDPRRDELAACTGAGPTNPGHASLQKRHGQIPEVVQDLIAITQRMATSPKSRHPSSLRLSKLRTEPRRVPKRGNLRCEAGHLVTDHHLGHCQFHDLVCKLRPSHPKAWEKSRRFLRNARLICWPSREYLSMLWKTSVRRGCVCGVSWGCVW